MIKIKRLMLLGLAAVGLGLGGCVYDPYYDPYPAYGGPVVVGAPVVVYQPYGYGYRPYYGGGRGYYGGGRGYYGGGGHDYRHHYDGHRD